MSVGKLFILVIIIAFAGSFTASSQSKTMVITGKFMEKPYADIIMYKKGRGFKEVIANYHVNPKDPAFAFILTVDTATTYSILIALKKPNRNRFDIIKHVEYPFRPEAGHNILLTVIPSLLDTVNNRGLVLRQGPIKPSIAIIKGRMNSLYNNSGTLVTLQKVVDGERQDLTAVNIPKTTKGFMIALPVKEGGFYYFSTVTLHFRIYLKPSDELNLNIDASTGNYVILKGSEENQLVSNWQRLAIPITGYGYNMVYIKKDTTDFDKYKTAYENLEPSIEDFKKNINTKDKRFNKLMNYAVDVDREFAPLYLLAYRSDKLYYNYPPDFKGYKEVDAFFRRFIQPGKFPDAAISAIGETNNFINYYAKLNVALLPADQQKELSKEDRLKFMMNTITNDTLKAMFLADQLKNLPINNLSEFKKTFEPLKKFARLPGVRNEYNEVFARFSNDTAYLGKSSYNFSIPDMDGKMVSMKDFRGKVIFIDTWATWCGPCKEELPFMKRIEEEYKSNTDIVFMGISVDKEKDRQKWIDFIAKEKLPGVQLLDDMGKTFRSKYGIMTIPRFLLIGKDGNWIEVRCPRPSDPIALKKYLDDALNNKTEMVSVKN